MFIYRIKQDGLGVMVDDTMAQFHGTLDTAKEVAKRHGAQRIDLLDFTTDKDGILKILNGNPSFRVERSWMITRRGGWSEIEVGEPIPATQAAEVGDSAPPQPVVATLVSSHAEDAKARKAATRFAATGIDLEGEEPLPLDAKAEAEVAEYRAANPYVPYDERVKGKVK